MVAPYWFHHSVSTSSSLSRIHDSVYVSKDRSGWVHAHPTCYALLFLCLPFPVTKRNQYTLIKQSNIFYKAVHSLATLCSANYAYSATCIFYHC